MIVPRRTLAAWKLIEALQAHGALSFEEGVQIHRMLGRNRSSTRAVYESAIRNGWIRLSGKRYRLTLSLLDWLASEEAANQLKNSAVVLPPYRPPFKPLSVQNMPSRYGPRDSASSKMGEDA